MSDSFDTFNPEIAKRALETLQTRNRFLEQCLIEAGGQQVDAYFIEELRQAKDEIAKLKESSWKDFYKHAAQIRTKNRIIRSLKKKLTGQLLLKPVVDKTVTQS